MKTLFPLFRAVVWLKRIALALETANDMTNRRMKLEHGAEWDRPRRKPELVKVTHPTVADWNKEWQRRNPQNVEE